MATFTAHLIVFILGLFIDLTLFISLSFKERGRDSREGRSSSLFYTPPSLIKRRGSGGWVTK